MRGTYPATLPDVKALELLLYFPQLPNETSSYGASNLASGVSNAVYARTHRASTAPGRIPAFAAKAGSRSVHDRAAARARRSVAKIKQIGDALFASGGLLRRHVMSRRRQVEHGQLFPLEEAKFQPAEDVIHEALGVADLLIAGPARRLKAHVRKLLAKHLERNAMLEADGDGCGDRVHQTGNGGTFSPSAPN